MHEEDWVAAWETYCGVAPRLTHFFSSEPARRLIEECRRQDLQPQMLAFTLIHFVWPAEEQRKLPAQATLNEGAAVILKAARWLSQYGKEGLPLPGVDEVTNRLRQYETALRQEIKTVSIGNVALAERPHSRRERGKRRTVFFLTECARAAGTARPPWVLITEFLVSCGLVPPATKPKTVATWWSNCLERDRTQQERPDTWKSELEKHQEGFFEWFRTMNQEITQSDSKTNSPE